jgi:FkbM family methyltransferase
MDDSSLKRLAKGERLKASSPAGKLMRAPLRMGISRLLGKVSRWRVRPVSARAKIFWGESMEVAFPDAVSVAIYQFGFFESGLTRIVMDRLKPGMVFFDVGAHFGYFTLLASHLVGKTGQAHAFEPTPSTFKILSANTAGRNNIHLNQKAVYSHAQTLTFTTYDSNPAFNTIGDGSMADMEMPPTKSHTYEVSAVSIDAYCAASGVKPDFIKLDAEGAEEQILNGMSKTMREIRPMISLEVGDFKKGYSRNLVELFLSRGYQAMEFNPNLLKLIPHELKEKYSYDNLLLLPKP